MQILDDFSKTEITIDEYPRFYYICYYERFRDYGLLLRIARKEKQ
ncbi:MAG: hypothetical protein PHX62_00540 [Bacilli bacterium]|nr:hypothetical protein [Bacilli bacterium]